ncbi:MAG: OmpA family protein [Acidobacteriia bacterium]|nr:OmpA family protein [Terriglobia bacterium]
MKDHTLITLLLSTALALPAFAQQSSSSSNAPLPSQSENTICNEELQPASSGDFWNGAEPNLANLIGHPLAGKKYVQGQVQPIQDCVNKLDDVAASHTNMIKDIDGRSHQGIELASARVKEADEHAIDADNRAKTAQQAATQTTAHLSTVEQVVGNIDQYMGGTQTEIDFRPGQTVLNKKAKEALDQMAAPLKDQRSYVIEVRGFSSGHGQAAIAASQQMAGSVVRYLVLTHKIPVHRIYVVGMGNAPVAAVAGTRAKRASSGRVEISLLKNDLVSSVQH